MDVSIALTRYREPNWLVHETLESLARQQGVRAEVLFLDQMRDGETEARLRELATADIAFHYIPIEERGLSFARNEAIRQAARDILLFIDPDAVAEPDWAQTLARPLTRSGVVVAGGRIVPRWHGRPPSIARARVVRDFYSLLDLGPGEQEVERIVGANLGIDRAAAGSEACFDEAYGRRKGKLYCGEESDLCRRVREQGGAVLYAGNATVHHQILPERLSYRWILKRTYYAGIFRGTQRGTPRPTHAPGVWDYLALPVILPAYALGYLRGRLA